MKFTSTLCLFLLGCSANVDRPIDNVCYTSCDFSNVAGLMFCDNGSAIEFDLNPNDTPLWTPPVGCTYDPDAERGDHDHVFCCDICSTCNITDVDTWAIPLILLPNDDTAAWARTQILNNVPGFIEAFAQKQEQKIQKRRAAELVEIFDAGYITFDFNENMTLTYTAINVEGKIKLRWLNGCC